MADLPPRQEDGDKGTREARPKGHVEIANVAMDEARKKTQFIEGIRGEDPEKYNVDVPKAVTSTLNKEPGKHQVKSSDGRYYSSDTKLQVPELDAQGKPTGKTIDAEKLDNGSLAKLLNQTVDTYNANLKDYNARLRAQGVDPNTTNQLEAEKPKLDRALDAVQKQTKLGDDDFNRMLMASGDLSPADKKMFANEKDMKAFVDERQKWRDYNTKVNKFEAAETAVHDQMSQSGKTFPGKMNLCCCTNARNKALGMMNWAKTGSQLDGSACHTLNLQNLDLTVLQSKKT